MSPQYAHPEVLVDTAWVEAHRQDPAVRIVESDEDVLLYSQGHVPGAVKIDWHTDLQDAIRRDYIDSAAFARLCSSKGNRPRHGRRLLRRQKQLVGLLRLLDLQALRPRRVPDHERRPQKLGTRRPPLVARSRAAISRRPNIPAASPTIRSGRFATKCCGTAAPAGRWSTSARRANTPAKCCTCPTIRKREPCAAGISPARQAFPGRGR